MDTIGGMLVVLVFLLVVFMFINVYNPWAKEVFTHNNPWDMDANRVAVN